MHLYTCPRGRDSPVISFAVFELMFVRHVIGWWLMTLGTCPGRLVKIWYAQCNGINISVVNLFWTAISPHEKVLFIAKWHGGQTMCPLNVCQSHLVLEWHFYCTARGHTSMTDECFSIFDISSTGISLYVMQTSTRFTRSTTFTMTTSIHGTDSSFSCQYIHE